MTCSTATHKHHSLACCLGLVAVRLYQIHISPRKGYQCAHRVFYGRHSCSTHAVHLLNRIGFLATIRLMKRRFSRCKHAANLMDQGSAPKRQVPWTSGKLFFDPCCGGVVGAAAVAGSVTSSNNPYKGCLGGSDNNSSGGSDHSDEPYYD